MPSAARARPLALRRPGHRLGSHLAPAEPRGDLGHLLHADRQHAHPQHPPLVQKVCERAGTRGRRAVARLSAGPRPRLVPAAHDARAVAVLVDHRIFPVFGHLEAPEYHAAGTLRLLADLGRGTLLHRRASAAPRRAPSHRVRRLLGHGAVRARELLAAEAAHPPPPHQRHRRRPRGAVRLLRFAGGALSRALRRRDAVHD
mmetsp:Transcript_3646/g.8671  ORF Transcript_3646/g.8671 Transcript_3646/m.8671 type:complete len:201 (+) Transcript_3646:1159-1761(+)